jgi:hypothetical protein
MSLGHSPSCAQNGKMRGGDLSTVARSDAVAAPAPIIILTVEYY